MLQCPKCGSPIQKNGNSYKCVQGHSFDVAKRGYVNLVLSQHKQTGDDKGMVQARTAFLEHGYYQALQEQLLTLLQSLSPNIVVDAGCGQGYYTNAVKKALHCDVYGFDLSKFAIDEACKAHADVVYGVANIFHLPILKESCDVLLSVFAPFDEDEAIRVVKEQGYVIKVGPGPKHLYELKQVLYEQVYENEAPAPLTKLTLCKELFVTDQIHVLGQADIKALFQMTPYYWKSPRETSAQLMQQKTLDTRIEFHIQVYQKG